MRTPEQIQEDYIKYRGKCKQMSEAACEADPTLTLVKGTYFCPIWCSEEFHWWTVRQDGTIYDPTAAQFPSNGHGFYEPFNGYYSCEECGEEVKEEDIVGDGSHMFCSNRCYARCVGLEAYL